MSITITNIRVMVNRSTFYGAGKRFNELVHNGYDVDFIINKEIESKITIPTENEMTIEEIKKYIQKELRDDLDGQCN